MKQFMEPTIEILALDVADIVTSSGDWAGWNLYDGDSDSQSGNSGWSLE